MKASWIRLIGGLFWLGCGLIAVVALGRLAGFGQGTTAQDSSSETPGRAPVSLARYLAGPTLKIRAGDPTRQLAVHDPIFFQAPDGRWSQAGYVQSVQVGSANQPNQLRLAWFDDSVAVENLDWGQYRNRGSLEDVAAIMLPPQQRLKIQQRMAAALSAHGDELSDAFVPLVRESLARSMPVIEEELKRSIANHRDEIDRLAVRMNDEMIAQRLVPLAKARIVPIVKQHAAPEVNEIGRELWDRASIWSFGWRAVVDQTPLARKKNLVGEEWERFVDEEAVPVFESHMDGIVGVIQNVVRDVSADSVVRGELADMAGEMAGDPEVETLVRKILTETLIHNDRLREVWAQVWTSDEARAALNLAGDRLEPVVRQIGDDLFGTRESGINPNFARVLRNQILGKDRRWIVAVPKAPSTEDPSDPNGIVTIPLRRETMVYPIIHMADRETSP